MLTLSDAKHAYVLFGRLSEGLTSEQQTKFTSELDGIQQFFEAAQEHLEGMEHILPDTTNTPSQQD
jgi:hypothetical protein